MDKYEQIGKLAEAYSLITEVINARDADDKHAGMLQDIANTIADISDDIEEG